MGGWVCWWSILSVFVYLRKSLFHFHFWKIFSLGRKFQVDRFFFLALKMLVHYSLTQIVSEKKSAVILIFVSLNISFFLCQFKNVLFITSFEQFYYDGLWYSFLYFSYAWGSSSFLDLWVYIFYHFRKMFGHQFSSFFPFTPSFSLF